MYSASFLIKFSSYNVEASTIVHVIQTRQFEPAAIYLTANSWASPRARFSRRRSVISLYSRSLFAVRQNSNFVRHTKCKFIDSQNAKMIVKDKFIHQTLARINTNHSIPILRSSQLCVVVNWEYEGSKRINRLFFLIVEFCDIFVA